MKNILISAPYIAIILLLIYIGSCTHRGKNEAQIVIKDSIVTVNNVDSFPIEGKTVYYPVPYEVIKHDYIPGDTVYILADYSTEKKYIIPIRDSIGNLDIDLTIQYNGLKKYNYAGQYKTYTTTITDTKYVVTPKRNKLLVGLVLSGNTEMLGAAPVIGLKTKKDNIFVAGYDVINRTYQVGYMLSIGKR